MSEYVDASFTSSVVTADIDEPVTFVASPTFEKPLNSDWADNGEANVVTERGTDFSTQTRTQRQTRDVVSHAWVFSGGSPSHGTAASLAVTFDAAGVKPVRLTVTRAQEQRDKVEVRQKSHGTGTWPSAWSSPTYSQKATLIYEDVARGQVDIGVVGERVTGTQIYDPTVDPDGDPTTDMDKKYWRMFVPDFNGTRAAPASSYIRLGAVEQPVYDLWSTATVEYNDDGTRMPPRFSTGAGAPHDRTATQAFFEDPNLKASGEDLAALVVDFIDDYRERGEPDDGNIPEQDQRRQDSARLHTRGGWRDHTDGNRITTTRGDKVEVIRGNYKMVVLGRQQFADDGANQSGDTVDRSGGIVQDIDQTPYAVTTVGWDDKLDTWKVDETGSRGHYTSVTDGYSYTRFRGREDSYTHGETYSYHGPPTAREVTIDGLDLSWPAEPESLDEVDTSNCKAVEVVRADVESYHVGDLKERTANGTINSQAFWGAKGGVDIGGISGELTIGIEKIALQIVGNMIDVVIASQLNVFVGGAVNIRVGPEVDIATSDTTEIRPSSTKVAASDKTVAASSSTLAASINLN